MDAERARDGAGRRVSGGRATRTHRAADPVVAVLLLAGLFDGMAGNPVHALVLAGAGFGLVALPPRVGPAEEAVPGRRRIPAGRRPWVTALGVAVAYGIVAGSLERYTWPVTFAILVPGIAALVLASRSRWRTAPSQPLDRSGAGLWVAALIALGLFELLNFVLQPDRLTGSPDHPTLSTLFNEVVVTHPRQALALTLWLLAGWWLVER